MNATTEKCPVCNSDDTSIQLAAGRNTIYYVCPVCGHFELDLDIPDRRNMNHLASYLFYNAFHERADSSPRYYTELSEEYCAGERKKHSDEYRHLYRLPYHMDVQIVENWFPKSFSERVDAVLLYLNTRAKHVGASVVLSSQESFSLLFVDRKEECEDRDSPDYGKMIWRNEAVCEDEAHYMLNFLSESGLIQYTDGPSEEDAFEIVISPAGYSRIDEISKNTGHGRNVLVAMKFGKETNPLREAIRKGIQEAKYNAIFIDEVQHNDFITPELLKYIRDSKFVVVDLTHQNNGAYFEEGYAMGLGKPVIQLCNIGTKLHFDIAQKNTIMWETEDDIPIRLTNRIKATID